MMCKWWDNEHECCTHPKSPNDGYCVSWLDICLYEENEEEKEDE